MWERLDELKRFGMKPGLERMEKLLDVLGHPERKYKTVHVAGTNGKGSVCALVASALNEAGYRTGLYTSPHLIRPNERFKIDGEDISDEELSALSSEIIDLAEEHAIDITFFEATTLISFLYFARNDVDIAVIEVGLGGDWDATNVIQPEVAVITNVGSDHARHLGSTIEERTRRKGGIIKPGASVVIGAQDDIVVGILQEMAKENEVSIVKEELTAISRQQENGQDITFTGRMDHTIHLALDGHYQRENASTALVALLELKERGVEISLDHVEWAWKRVRWPGRMDRRGRWLLDAAHNPEGMTKLAHALKREESITLIIGMKEGKEAEEMMGIIAPLAERIITTEAFNAIPAQRLAEMAEQHCDTVTAASELGEAMRLAKNVEGLLVVTGSLYLVGDALKLLETQGL